MYFVSLLFELQKNCQKNVLKLLETGENKGATMKTLMPEVPWNN